MRIDWQSETVGTCYGHPIKIWERSIPPRHGKWGVMYSGVYISLTFETKEDARVFIIEKMVSAESAIEMLAEIAREV